MYLWRRKKTRLVRRVVIGELAWYAGVAGLLFYNWQATVVVSVVPFLLVRFLMMAGNWAQHAFIDGRDPSNPYKSSIVCVNSRYNRRCFNDGYHVEHHRRPALHWTDLPLEAEPSTRNSRWPAVLRWLDGVDLEMLERLVLRSPLLQRFVLDRHEQAFRPLLRRVDGIQRVAIVGGGLFPRSALILTRLLPGARISIIDENAENLETARRRLHGSPIEFVHAAFDVNDVSPADLLVVPLDFHGRRDRLYRWPPAKAVIVHDWIWSRRPTGPTAIVSCFLLKRLNLVLR